MARLNTLSGSERKNFASQIVDKVVSCVNAQSGEKLRKYGSDSVIWSDGYIYDIIKSSGSGQAEFQCLVTNPPVESSPNTPSGSPGYTPAITQEGELMNQITNNPGLLIIGALVVGLILYKIFK